MNNKNKFEIYEEYILGNYSKNTIEKLIPGTNLHSNLLSLHLLTQNPDLSPTDYKFIQEFIEKKIAVEPGLEIKLLLKRYDTAKSAQEKGGIIEELTKYLNLDLNHNPPSYAQKHNVVQEIIPTELDQGKLIDINYELNKCYQEGDNNRLRSLNIPPSFFINLDFGRLYEEDWLWILSRRELGYIDIKSQSFNRRLVQTNLEDLNSAYRNMTLDQLNFLGEKSKKVFGDFDFQIQIIPKMFYVKSMQLADSHKKQVDLLIKMLEYLNKLSISEMNCIKIYVLRVLIQAEAESDLSIYIVLIIYYI